MKLGLRIYPKNTKTALIEHNGEIRIKFNGENRTRPVKTDVCAYCSCDIAYDARLHSGENRYCSYECYTIGGGHLVICDHCGKEFFRNKSKQDAGKNNYNFCCRACKEQEQCIGGLLELDHYGPDLAYRNKAFNHYGKSCSVCGISEEYLLVVHHKDGDRKNNKLDNLVVLCHNHHAEQHKKVLRSGRVVLDYNHT